MFFKIIYLILIAQVQIDGQSSIPDPSQIIDMPSNSSLIATITNTCSGLELIMVAINAAIQHAICTGIEILELLNKLPQNVAKQIGRTITSLQSLANALDKLITLLPFLGSVQQCNQQLIGQLKQAQTDSNAKVNAISKIFVEINTRIEAQAMSPKCLLEVTQLKANIQSEFNKNIFNCVNMYSSQASSILSGSLNKVTSLVATILPLISAKRLGPALSIFDILVSGVRESLSRFSIAGITMLACGQKEATNASNALKNLTASIQQCN